MKDIKYYQKLAERNDAEAEYILSMEYLLGVEVEADEAMAKSWLKKAYEHGSSHAAYLLGLYCLNDKVDVDRAVMLFEIAAEKKHAPAQYILGLMSFWGTLGVPLDIDLAKECFERASTLKSADAQNMLGIMHYYGIGYSQDYVEAMVWFTKGAKRTAVDFQLFRDKPGLLDAPSPLAQVNLSSMFLTGEGGVKNKKHASDWLWKSKKLADIRVLSDCSTPHIEMLSDKAVEFVGNKVIEQDNFDFISKHIALWCFQYSRLIYGVPYVLGKLFAADDGWVVKSTKVEEEWYLRGVKQGDLRAKTCLSERYSQTNSKAKIKKAIKWMNDEAKRDNENEQIAQLATRLNEKLDLLNVKTKKEEKSVIDTEKSARLTESKNLDDTEDILAVMNSYINEQEHEFDTHYNALLGHIELVKNTIKDSIESDINVGILPFILDDGQFPLVYIDEQWEVKKLSPFFQLKEKYFDGENETNLTFPLSLSGNELTLISCWSIKKEFNVEGVEGIKNILDQFVTQLISKGLDMESFGKEFAKFDGFDGLNG